MILSKSVTKEKYDRLCPKVTGKADFTGKLRGEDVTLKGVNTKEISYIKKDTAELNTLRNDFNTSVRKSFLEDLSKNVEYLKEAGFTEKDILYGGDTQSEGIMDEYKSERL